MSSAISTDEKSVATASSRLPVEIWQKILREAVNCPSLYVPSLEDGFSTNVEIFSSNRNEKVEKERTAVENTRSRLALVCQSWAHYLRSLPPLPPFVHVKELGSRSSILERKGLLTTSLVAARRLQLEVTPFPCGHRTTCWCRLPKDQEISYNLGRTHQLDAVKIYAAELERSNRPWELEMLFVDDDVPSRSVLFNASKLPNLKIFKYPTTWQPIITLDWISTAFVGLTHLHLRFDSRSVQGTLRLPSLHTFQMVLTSHNIESIQIWELPSLRYLSSNNSLAFFGMLRKFGHQLEGLQLTLRSRNEDLDELWDLCPNLQVLGLHEISSVVRSSRIFEPPDDHPLNAIFITLRNLNLISFPLLTDVFSTVEALTSWKIKRIYINLGWREFQTGLESLNEEMLRWWIDVTRAIKIRCRDNNIAFLDSHFHSLDSVDGQRLDSFMSERERK